MTRGILLMERTFEDYGNLIHIKGKNEENFFYKEEYFESESEAIKDAEQRKEKKLIQLRNQIEKLEKKNVITIKEV